MNPRRKLIEVAVLITKALVEIPRRFAGLPPVNAEARAKFAAGAA